MAGRTSWRELKAELEKRPGYQERAQAVRAKHEREEEAYHLALGELRRARGLTQTALARTLDKSQPDVSRIEREADLLLSTLRSYIQAMGGELALVARFRGSPPVELEIGALTSDMDEQEAAATA
ncbi:MAG: helix-turn-helix domain-containing protein [Nitriliruptorales bacterium]